MEKNMERVSTPVELTDAETKAVAGGFFNNSFQGFANGGNAGGGANNSFA